MTLGKCGSEAAPHGTPLRSEGISVDWFDRKTRKHDVESPLETSILDRLDRKRNFAAPHRSVSTMHALRSKFESDRLNKARPETEKTARPASTSRSMSFRIPTRLLFPGFRYITGATVRHTLYPTLYSPRSSSARAAPRRSINARGRGTSK
jgi:hypothetical protein